MNKEELRKGCSRLFKCEKIKDSNDLIDVYSEFLFLTINNHHNYKTSSIADSEAPLILQMIFTKILHLRGVIGGINYVSKDGAILDKVIDPTIVASLLRNVYETVGMFNLIYRSTKSSDEKTILYNLWVHSGLKYRQKFESAITTPENFQKLNDERKQIEQLIKEIESTALYKRLSEKNQNKIQTKLKDKDYLIRFENDYVVFLHWQELTKVMQVKNDLMNNLYTYFSLYSHPSNVAVFQFRNMFKKEEASFLELTKFNLNYLFILTSIFIADYIKLFPEVLKTYNSLDIRDQIVINFRNTLMRGQDYSINDSWKEVD